MPIQVDYVQDPTTGNLTPKVTDHDFEQRAAGEIEKVFRHVLETGTDYPTKMKRGMTTFWRTEVKQMGKTEFALNAGLGLGIALLVGATITPAGWAFAATAGLTFIAGFTAGKIQNAIDYRKGRKGVIKKTDNIKIPSGFTFRPNDYQLSSNYFDVLKIGDWKVAKPMLKSLWKHFSDIGYFKGRYLGGDIQKAEQDLEMIAGLFEAHKFKSQRKLNQRAATTRNIFRSDKKFDMGLKMKKFSYYAAWLHEFSRAWVDIINSLYGEYDALTVKLLSALQVQFHIIGNHANCRDCACCEEFNQLALLKKRTSNITLSRRMQRDLGLKSGVMGQHQLSRPVQNQNPQMPVGLEGDISVQHQKKLGGTNPVSHIGQSLHSNDFYDKVWSIGDACTETQTGNYITASLGKFAETQLGSVVSGASGGVAGAGIGKLFGWIGRHFSVKIPVKGNMAEVFSTWASGEAFLPSQFLKKQCYSADYLEYVISKLDHYQTKYDSIVKNYRNDLEKLNISEDNKFPFHSCDHARDILSKHAALFLQLAKFHSHVEYLNIFSHAMQECAEDLVYNLQRKPELSGIPEVRTWLASFNSIDKWLRYYNSIFGEIPNELITDHMKMSH